MTKEESYQQTMSSRESDNGNVRLDGIITIAALVNTLTISRFRFFGQRADGSMNERNGFDR